MIYIASKTKHAGLWKYLRDTGYPCNMKWLNHQNRWEEEFDPEKLWTDCFEDLKECSCLVLYATQEDILKGALVEVGAMLAQEKPCFTYGLYDQTISNHPLVYETHSFDLALKSALKFDRNQNENRNCN